MCAVKPCILWVMSPSDTMSHMYSMCTIDHGYWLWHFHLRLRPVHVMWKTSCLPDLLFPLVTQEAWYWPLPVPVYHLLLNDPARDLVTLFGVPSIVLSIRSWVSAYASAWYSLPVWMWFCLIKYLDATNPGRRKTWFSLRENRFGWLINFFYELEMCSFVFL